MNKKPETVFTIRRIYSKDVSFEIPKSPDIFSKDWKPQVNVEMNSTVNQLAENTYEVTLNISVTTKSNDEIAYICEVIQAGIFYISGLEHHQLEHCLGAYCPNILFPFVREIVSNLANKGTFPAINLDPINFDAIFMSYVDKKKNPLEDKASKPDRTIQ